MRDCVFFLDQSSYEMALFLLHPLLLSSPLPLPPLSSSFPLLPPPPFLPPPFSSLLHLSSSSSLLPPTSSLLLSSPPLFSLSLPPPLSSLPSFLLSSPLFPTSLPPLQVITSFSVAQSRQLLHSPQHSSTAIKETDEGKVVRSLVEECYLNHRRSFFGVLPPEQCKLTTLTSSTLID